MKQVRSFLIFGCFFFIFSANIYSQSDLKAGHSNYAKGDYDNAIKKYDDEIKNKPNSPDGYVYRASAYLQKGNFTQAIADLTKAISINPKATAYYIGRAQAYLQNSDTKNAIADYNMAIILKPTDAQLYFFRALAYQQANDKKNGCVDILKAKELGYINNIDQLQQDICK